MRSEAVEVSDPTGEPARGRRASRDAAERAEPRALRTRASVLEAISEAIGNGELATLTVSELCRRARIHRVTFYKHWTELGDAVAEALAEVVDALATISPDAIARASGVHELALLYREALLAELGELRERREVYRELLAASGGQSLREALHRVLEERARLAMDAIARAGGEVPTAGRDLAAAYVGGGAAAALVAFVRGDEENIEDAAAAIMAQWPSWWPRPDE
ncbi:hypothetical protein KIH74_30345 [Kineosporia sp. J2-2]|uniref:HTH tetR-type domain-containing protein n=1 Tax=Kineosporia corallincola TaxID=2835133 RepID=A0ABS5TQ94_9ACTN|nr:hypothetical protein [Kineosporia corallincola]MBT0773284.1 hypothetical protein [Kineosporia corallincola]